jgi:beta-glucosidase
MRDPTALIRRPERRSWQIWILISMKIILPAGSPMLSPEFVFGVATSAFQIEGAANKRLPCVWDTFCATPGKIRDRSDGKIACDHLARWREDLALVASLGVDAYRFSVSWPRVINIDGSINEQGIAFYLHLLDDLNDRDIKPFVTLYHWDLPQHLEDAGGWLIRDTAYRFRDYVDLATRRFGDRVYSYATLNEPWCNAYLGYEIGVHAPGLADKSFGKKAAHNLLLAHGLAMQALTRNSRDSFNGIVLNFTPCYGATDSAEDQAAAAAADVVLNDWYLMPLIDGRYPDLVNRLPGAELPDIHAGDLEIISHRLDFVGVNYYTRGVYRADDERPFVQLQPAGPLTDMGWEVYPQGLTDLLLSLDSRYDLPPIYVAENGAAVADTIEDGEVNDECRTRYIQTHLDALSTAIEHGADIAGYFYWSLMDNFEWAEGYSKRFGIVHVDFESQRRTLKASGQAYRDFLGRRARGVL